MSALFVLTLLASVPAFVLGMINPKWVLPGVKAPTRKLAAGIYTGSFFGSLILLFVSLSISNPPESVAEQPVVEPVASPQAAPAVKPDWKTYLPSPDAELRAKYEADPYLKGWLGTQDVWIGRSTEEDLLKRGFFVNTQWRHNGIGTEPEGTTRGSCSALDFEDGFICGVGAFGSPSWGVQDETTIRAFQQYMN
ncbi:MAG: hypothetical protein IGS54_08875 [Elainella sp. C42_A2020_010]|nr:hypothetical protein [Elainella sp. C42_A2020_010]